MDTLGTRDAVQKSFDRDILNNQQEIIGNYDQGKSFLISFDSQESRPNCATINRQS